MADIIDSGNDAADTFLKAALSRRAKENVPEFTGRCHNCNIEVHSPMRWCDPVCRDEWEEFETRARQNDE